MFYMGEYFLWMDVLYGWIFYMDECFTWMNVLHGWMFYIDGCLTWMESIIGKSVQQQLHPALLKLIFRVNDLTILHNGWNNKQQTTNNNVWYWFILIVRNDTHDMMFGIGVYCFLDDQPSHFCRRNLFLVDPEKSHCWLKWIPRGSDKWFYWDSEI